MGKRKRVQNPLAIAAVFLSGVQLFFQMVDAKALVSGTWWSLAGMAVAAAVLTVNGYMHAYRQQGQVDARGASQQNAPGWSQPMPPVWEPAPSPTPSVPAPAVKRTLAPDWRDTPLATSLRDRMGKP